MSVRESRFTAPLSVVDASTATTAVDSTGRRTLTMDKLWSREVGYIVLKKPLLALPTSLGVERCAPTSPSLRSYF